jgi:hypothetical protein
MLLVGPPVPDRSRVMTQTKRDTLVLQAFGVGLTTPYSKKNLLLRKSNKGKSWIDLTMMGGKGLNIQK